MFQARLETLSKDYESVSDQEVGENESFVRVIDAGRRVDSYQIDGYLRAKIVFFLMNISIKPNPIYLSRHGQSEFNLKHLLGGDSELTADGRQYAKNLSEHVIKEPEIINHEKGDFHVFCTTLVRTQQTAFSTCEACPQAVTTIWKNLAEIDAGICEGMTYAQVEQKYPEIAAARKADKLKYRYPQGESYEDLIKRLEPIIIELERIQRPILVIAHQAVLRCLYAYFFDLKAETIPYLSIPLHTVIKLEPKATGCIETRTELGPIVTQ
jgi:broad specificity phosphatase PhoE